ncbi:hypothetical protein JXR93_12330 [bacterium]|nr:hypothetical protein [bacterium]
MNDIKNDKNNLSDDAARLRERLSKSSSNPIDDVVGMMLKSDAKSCKLASARLSQLEESAKSSSGTADESLPRDSKEEKESRK